MENGDLSLEFQLKDLTKEISKLGLENTKAKESAMCKAASLKSIEKKVRESSNTTLVMQEDVDEAEKELNSLKEHNQECRNEIADLQGKIRNSCQKIDSINPEWFDESEDVKIKRLMQHIELIKKKNENLSLENEKIRKEYEESEQTIDKLTEEGLLLVEKQVELEERSKNAEEELETFTERLSLPIIETEADEKRIEIVKGAAADLQKLIDGLNKFDIDSEIKSDESIKRKVANSVERQKDINQEIVISIDLEKAKKTCVKQTMSISPTPSSPRKTVNEISASRDFVERMNERFDSRYVESQRDKAEIKFVEAKYANDKIPTEASYRKKEEEVARLTEEAQNTRNVKEELNEVSEELMNVLEAKKEVEETLDIAERKVQSQNEIIEKTEEIKKQTEEMRKEQEETTKDCEEKEKEIEERRNNLVKEEEEIRKLEEAAEEAEEELLKQLDELNAEEL